MLIKELRGTESTQDACAKMRVSLPNDFLSSCRNTKHRYGYKLPLFQLLFSSSVGQLNHLGAPWKKGVRALFMFVFELISLWFELESLCYMYTLLHSLLFFKNLNLIIYTLIILQIRIKTIFSLLHENVLGTHLTVLRILKRLSVNWKLPNRSIESIWYKANIFSETS